MATTCTALTADKTTRGCWWKAGEGGRAGWRWEEGRERGKRGVGKGEERSSKLHRLPTTLCSCNFYSGRLEHSPNGLLPLQ